MKLANRLRSVEQQVKERMQANVHAQGPPCAYGPRPVYQARFIEYLHNDPGDHSERIRKIMSALESELSRRPQFKTDPDVIKGLNIGARYVVVGGK